LLLIKPYEVPRWMERGLGTIPFIYLGLAVLFAATGSTFIICRYDPFIPIFRLSGSLFSLILAGVFVVAALFVGRPYCRFLCPYGALLKLASAVSRWRVRITPDVCTQCTLCAESCPFGVIAVPGSSTITPKNLSAERLRLALLFALVPALILCGALAGVRFGEWTSSVNPDVKLAAQYVTLRSGQKIELPDKPAEMALLRAERVADQLLPAAQSALRRFRIGGAIFGAWIGLVIGVRLILFMAGRRREEFEPERTGCFACARCFGYCPQERLRLGLPAEPPSAGNPTAQPV
jgi:ferredoxin